MDQIESYLNRVSACVGGAEDLRRHLRQEIRSHLEEIIAGNISAGLSQEEAVKQALESFGDPASVREGLESVYGRRHLAFLIEKAMDWRESTMKNAWKWNFVIGAMVILLIALQVSQMGFILVFMFPKLAEIYDRISPPNPIAASLFSFAAFVNQNLLLILILIAAAWALFEWKVRNENKSIIRLTCGIAVSLILGSLAICFSTATIIAFAVAGR